MKGSRQMKQSTFAALSGALLLMGILASSKGGAQTTGEKEDPSNGNKSTDAMRENRITIRIGTKIFAATLSENPTAAAFKAMLPLSLNMSDLHGNEKFFHLPSRLPSNDANPGTIQTGDLMLWSSKSVVLFYKTFPTSFSYTRLGRIGNPAGLPAAVGKGDVTISFELE